MFNQYYEMVVAQQRDVERQIEERRRLREALRHRPSAGRRFRITLGRALLRLGATLVNCEELSRSSIRQRTVEEPR